MESAFISWHITAYLIQHTKLGHVKIVLRDPPLPFLVMAIVMKVPMSKSDQPIRPAPIPPVPAREIPAKPNQWARGASASGARRAG